METEQLKLENQFCFPVYAASRLIIREYQPFLDKLAITYPQYLVLMVLWATDGVSVNDITEKLILNTNTITPLLKRMEIQELITRRRSAEDERKVLITLTEKGKEMRKAAALIPEQLSEKLNTTTISLDRLVALKDTLNELINSLNDKQKNK